MITITVQNENPLVHFRKLAGKVLASNDHKTAFDRERIGLTDDVFKVFNLAGGQFLKSCVSDAWAGPSHSQFPAPSPAWNRKLHR